MAAAEVGHIVVGGRGGLRLPANEGEGRRPVEAGKPAGAAQAAGGGVEARRLLSRIHLGHHGPTEPEMLGGHDHECTVAPHPLPLRLVGPAPTGLGQHRVGTHVGGQPPFGLLLQTPVGVPDQAVPVGQPNRHLAPELIEIAQVGGHGAIDARDRLVDAEVVVEAVEPGAVAQDGPADVGVGFEEEQVRVAGVAAGFQVGIRVVADEILVLVIGVQHPAEVVASALHGHHDQRAGRGHLHVGAGRRGGELFDGIVIEIESGAFIALGGVDAVGQDPVLSANAEALVAGLLALVGASDIEATHPDTGRLPQYRPDIGGGRHLLQLGHAEVVDQRRPFHVQHRRVARHRDRLGHGCHLQRRVDPDGAAPFHDHPFSNQSPEPGALERQVV